MDADAAADKPGLKQAHHRSQDNEDSQVGGQKKKDSAHKKPGCDWTSHKVVAASTLSKPCFYRPFRRHLPQDRKSTRLNCSHVATSYSVACLHNKYIRCR